MQKAFLLLLIVVCEVKGQVGNTKAPCLPSQGETGDNNYAVLKRKCYIKYGFEYSPTFYPLTKAVLYNTSQATHSCGKELSVMFYGAQVCVSFIYQEYRPGFRNIGLVLSHSKCKQKCFKGTATITERKTFGTPSYKVDSESKSDLELILTPNHHGIQPTKEPCYPEVGETGSSNAAVLKRIWCMIYNKKICFTALYPLVKGVPFMTSQANTTYGRDVSVIFYGKEVCIAYIYEHYGYRLTSDKKILKNSYCSKTCFTGWKWNIEEFREGPADPFNPTLKWESDYQLIVPKEDTTGRANCKAINFIFLSLSILMSMFF